MVAVAVEARGRNEPGQALEQLEGLSGIAFDALFLELMIEHHLGAVGMVDALFAAPGSMQDSELFQFASDVGSEQLEEICVMEALLERLAPALVPAAPAPDLGWKSHDEPHP